MTANRRLVSVIPTNMGRVGMFLDLVAEFVMGRVCQGPSLSWAEFVMGRNVSESLERIAAYDKYD